MPVPPELAVPLAVSVLVLLFALVLLLRMRRRRAGRHVASREVRTLRAQVRTLEAALAALAGEQADEAPEEESLPEQAVEQRAGQPRPEAVEPLPDEVMNKCVDRVRLSLHGLVDRIGGDEAALLVLARVDAAVARLATTPAMQRPALAPAPSAVPAAAVQAAASPATASSAASRATGPVPATPQAAQPPVPPVNGHPDRVLPIPAPSGAAPSQGRRWFRRNAARNAA